MVVALATIVIFHDEMWTGLELATFAFLIVMLPWVPYFVLQWRQIPVSEARFARRRWDEAAATKGNGDGMRDWVRPKWRLRHQRG